MEEKNDLALENLDKGDQIQGYKKHKDHIFVSGFSGSNLKHLLVIKLNLDMSVVKTMNSNYQSITLTHIEIMIVYQSTMIMFMYIHLSTCGCCCCIFTTRT